MKPNMMIRKLDLRLSNSNALVIAILLSFEIL